MQTEHGREPANIEWPEVEEALPYVSLLFSP
jgi:hypothetical protein